MNPADFVAPEGRENTSPRREPWGQGPSVNQSPGGAIRHFQSRTHRRPMARANPKSSDSDRPSGAAIPFQLLTPWLAPWASVLSALRAF